MKANTKYVISFTGVVDPVGREVWPAAFLTRYGDMSFGLSNVRKCSSEREAQSVADGENCRHAFKGNRRFRPVPLNEDGKSFMLSYIIEPCRCCRDLLRQTLERGGVHADALRHMLRKGYSYQTMRVSANSKGEVKRQSDCAA